MVILNHRTPCVLNQVGLLTETYSYPNDISKIQSPLPVGTRLPVLVILIRQPGPGRSLGFGNFSQVQWSRTLAGLRWHDHLTSPSNLTFFWNKKVTRYDINITQYLVVFNSAGFFQRTLLEPEVYRDRWTKCRKMTF